MNEMNNLIYLLEISFVNKSGLDSSISIKLHDNGLKVKTVRVANVCITEETIKGRVYSGMVDNADGCCGYRYDYQNGGSLLNINSDIPINTAIALINKYKKETDFLTAELVLSSIVRNDYRVVILDEGNLNIKKTVSAENENSEYCCLQETVDLSKLSGEEGFFEKDKKRVYTIGDKIVEETQTFDVTELSDILSNNPQNYKELIEIKKQIQKSYNMNREKTL
jgi:hypothetical protein